METEKRLRTVYVEVYRRQYRNDDGNLWVDAEKPNRVIFVGSADV